MNTNDVERFREVNTGYWNFRADNMEVDLRGWFTSKFDPDIKTCLERHASQLPATVCDLGTGTGEQAIKIAEMGYKVVGTDIADEALERARQMADQTPGIDVSFVNDDVLESELAPDQFDVVIDRGCFHNLFGFVTAEPFLATIHSILRANGILIIKVMSSAEKRFQRSGDRDIKNPYHFSLEELSEVLADGFDLIEGRQTQYQSDYVFPPPLAVVAVFRRQSEARV